MKKYTTSLLLFCCTVFCTNLPAQTWKWVVGSDCPKSVIEAWPIAIDGNGNVYAGGDIFNIMGWPSGAIRSYFGRDTVAGGGGCVVSTDSNGHYRWAIHSSVMCNGLVADHDNVYAFGNFFLSMNFGGLSLTTPWTGSYCAKINSSGTVVWLKQFYDSTSIEAGAIDPAGNIYLAGSLQALSATIGPSHLVNASTPGGYDALVMKIDSAGSVLWASSFGADSNEYLNSIAVNGAGEAFVAGTFTSHSLTVGSSSLSYSPGPYPYGVVAGFSASGTPLWGDEIIDRYVLLVNSISVDRASNVYVGGGCQGNILFGTDSIVASNTTLPFFLASYNKAGHYRWSRTKGPSLGAVQNVVTDVCGNVWICGGRFSLTIPPQDPMYLYAYDTSGNGVDSSYLPTGGDDQAYMAVDNKGNLYICGDATANYRTDTFYIGADTLRIYDSTLETLFIAKLSYPTCTTMAATLETSWQETAPDVPPMLYPNPASDECTIKLPEGSRALTKAEVYDPTGRLIMSYTLSGTEAAIGLRNLKADIYNCIIYTTDGNRFSEKLAIIK